MTLGTEERQLPLDNLPGPLQADHRQRIDHDFPEHFVDSLSSREVLNKHLFRPNTYLHKWWARRCGSTFRTILKQFAVADKYADYYTPGGLQGKTILDPMMGGGTTLHEALRLGANVIGADIDPIPIAQARASLTQADLTGLRASFAAFFDQLHSNLKPYFQTECVMCSKTTDIRYTLYGIKKRCVCREVVQIDQYDLRHEAGRTISVNPQDWEVSSYVGHEITTERASRLITKSEKECSECGYPYNELLDHPFYMRYTPIAIASDCETHGLFFRSPSELDLARIGWADELRSTLDFGPLEDFNVEAGPKSDDLLQHNIKSYLDLFSSRQLLYLNHAIQILENCTGIEKLVLGMLVSTSLEFNSLLCGYKGWSKRRPGAIRHVFALHAYSFQYTALENNPINPQKSSGNLQILFRDRIVRGREWAVLPTERRINREGKSETVQIPEEVDQGVEVFRQADLVTGQRKFWLIQDDSRCLPIEDHSIDVVVTDPPYYDNVQYGNLSAFFRVWLNRLLPEETDWMYDESLSAVAMTKSDGNTSYIAALTGIFTECRRVLKPDTGRLVFTFHHWDPNAWAELTLSLKAAGFRLINTYVVSSEHPISTHIRNLNSIKHDSILVLALDDGVPHFPWMPLTDIDTADSEAFCRQCGAALGWMLDSAFDPSGIHATWKDLIRGGLNDQ